MRGCACFCLSLSNLLPSNKGASFELLLLATKNWLIISQRREKGRMYLVAAAARHTDSRQRRETLKKPSTSATQHSLRRFICVRVGGHGKNTHIRSQREHTRAEFNLHQLCLKARFDMLWRNINELNRIFQNSDI